MVHGEGTWQMSTVEELNEALEPYWSEFPVWRSADVGEGWVPLILDLIEDLKEIYPEFKVAQVKEKFGGLRFYPENYKKDYVGQSIHESRFYKRIAEAEQLSLKTCEVCGEPGVPGNANGGWILTLCDKHNKKEKS